MRCGRQISQKIITKGPLILIGNQDEKHFSSNSL
jgi:hypothetical protein